MGNDKTVQSKKTCIRILNSFISFHILKMNGRIFNVLSKEFSSNLNACNSAFAYNFDFFSINSLILIINAQHSHFSIH
jgi:hypothetical protein